MAVSGWEIQRLWGELKRQLSMIKAVIDDTADQTRVIAELKKAQASERAKRGWVTRRLNQMKAEQENTKARLAELIARVEALEAAGSTDEAAAREIFEEVAEHTSRLH
jgi:hypothetical protein